MTSRFLLVAAGVLGLLTGCQRPTVIVVNQPPNAPPPRARVVYVDEPATCAEIRAVEKLNFPNDRTAHLKRIARRPALGPRAQVEVVRATHQYLAFANDRVAVLNTLIENPVFCTRAKEAVLAQLDQLAFQNDRAQILQALDRRGPPIEFPEADAPVFKPVVQD